MRRVVVVALIAIFVALAGCPRPRVVEKPSGTAPEVPAPELAGAQLYDIDATASHVHVRVFRGGPMARLGHNHVMSVQGLRGRIWVQPRSLARSGFELRFPVAAVVVDDRAARSALGSDEFPPDIPDKDKAGTRTNMLRTEVLDGAKYPLIELRSIRVEGALPQPTIVAAITLKGMTREVRVPTKLSIDAQRVRAEGAFAIKQTDFGITPFSVAMGAVQVQDELQIRFDLTAIAHSGR